MYFKKWPREGSKSTISYTISFSSRRARKINWFKDHQITTEQLLNISLFKILTKVPFLNRESNLSAGEELSTYSTMLTPRPPLSDLGDSIAFTSLFPWKPCPDLLCTIIGWDIEWSVWKKECHYIFVLLTKCHLHKLIHQSKKNKYTVLFLMLL